MLNLVRTFIKAAGTRSLATAPSVTASLKLNQPAEIQYEKNFVAKPRDVWVESLETEEENFSKIIQLHPKVFAATPRMDIIHLNVEWQRKYRYVSFAHAKLRFECRGGGRKPWPQKGL